MARYRVADLSLIKDTSVMANLLSLITRVRNNQVGKSDWLYIVGTADDLTSQTEADFGCPDFDDDADKEIEPAGFVERGLQSTIDVETVKECIKWADRLSSSQDSNAVLDVLRYYIRFDAFPETLNPPDPPPFDDWLRQLDLEFCDKLGPEDPSNKCRREGCIRGVVKLSVFCRHHHFENIQKRQYPFDD
jgi:hypothetical protein